MSTKPGVRQFHKFLMGGFKASILGAYKAHRVLTEADLQAYAWQLIAEFLSQSKSRDIFRVLNKPYCRDLRIHPDLVIFKRGKAWVTIELKERRVLSERSARKEWKRLIQAKGKLGSKRGYLVYVARDGDEKVLRGQKGASARYFFEIPIILSRSNDLTPEQMKAWREEFRRWSKFRH